MGKTGVLGSFEEMVLLAVLHQGERAYAVSIRRQLAERSGSDVSMGAVYATLDRLQEKKLVEPREGHDDAPRPGRPRQYYGVRPEGLEALRETRRIRGTMWRGIDLAALDGGEVG